MLIIDDILLSPARGFLWIFNEIHNAAQQESADEPRQITAELSNLYMMLETGKLSEEEFASREKILLDLLDEIEKRRTVLEEEGEEKDDKLTFS